MALPKLNSEPKYELIIPSLKKKVKFRPFLVKEEKVLMIAMESGDQKDQSLRAPDILPAHTPGDQDPNQVPAREHYRAARHDRRRFGR